jgi:hypothetical protein
MVPPATLVIIIVALVLVLAGTLVLRSGVRAGGGRRPGTRANDERVCAHCRHENIAGARYCALCGHELKAHDA